MRLRFYWRARKFLRKWDSAEIRAMVKMLRKGDVALDVGCHKGGWLYWMRRAVGPSGQVHAFEPQPELAQYLKDVVQAFRWKNVFIHTCALGSESGHQNLHVPDSTGSTSASASLVAGVASSESNQAPTVHHVELQTLDSFVQTQGLRRVDFIKVDVEGFELEALKGAQKTLGNLRPAIMVECEKRHLRVRGIELQQVFDQVLKHDYTGQFFSQGARVPIEEFHGDVHQNEEGDRFWDRDSYANNFLFLPGSISGN
ncbi:MAG: FkbM family methyltransferase [Planctomycetes bacterium]|nr:FkbM family methyltransferase [Planctomycetota bacterium]